MPSTEAEWSSSVRSARPFPDPYFQRVGEHSPWKTDDLLQFRQQYLAVE